MEPVFAACASLCMCSCSCFLFNVKQFCPKANTVPPSAWNLENECIDSSWLWHEFGDTMWEVQSKISYWAEVPCSQLRRLFSSIQNLSLDIVWICLLVLEAALCGQRTQQKCKTAFHLSNCLWKARCYQMKSNENEKHDSPCRGCARRMSEQLSSCPHCRCCFLLS